MPSKSSSDGTVSPVPIRRANISRALTDENDVLNHFHLPGRDPPEDDEMEHQPGRGDNQHMMFGAHDEDPSSRTMENETLFQGHELASSSSSSFPSDQEGIAFSNSSSEIINPSAPWHQVIEDASNSLCASGK